MIREMTKDGSDIDEIMALWLESTITAHPFLSEAYWKENYDIVKNAYLPQSETYVYAEGPEIAGFISIVDKEFIGALFVSAKRQGCGIGAKLTAYAIEKYDQLSLAVYVENHNAVTFYRKMGFSVIAEQENADSHVMEYIMRRG